MNIQTIRNNILIDIEVARNFRGEPWGKPLALLADPNRSNEEKLAVISDAFGVVATGVAFGVVEGGRLALTFNDTHDGSAAIAVQTFSRELNRKLRTHLVTVAACCLAWIEAIDSEPTA